MHQNFKIQFEGIFQCKQTSMAKKHTGSDLIWRDDELEIQ